MARVQGEFPDAEVEVWAEDEHRLGLKPVLRAVWVSLGEQPIATVNWRFQWLWLYAFVHPESGETKRVAFALRRDRFIQSSLS